MYLNVLEKSLNFFTQTCGHPVLKCSVSVCVCVWFLHPSACEQPMRSVVCVAVWKCPEWQVGSRCRAVYREDGQTYDAVIISLDSEAGSCTVRYDYYNNEELQQLDDLMPPSHARLTNCNSRVRSAEVRAHQFAVVLLP